MSIVIKSCELNTLSEDFKVGLKDYSLLFKNGIRVKDVLTNQSYKIDINSGRTPSKFNPDYWEGDYDFITMSDVDTITFTLNEVSEEHLTDEAIDNEANLYQAPKDSLIISNAMTLGLSFLTERPVYINQNVFCLDIDDSKANKKFILWYFNLIIRKVMSETYSSKYLSKQELSMINLPKIDIVLQNKFEETIRPIENEILILKKKIKLDKDIIDEIFGDYFKFNYSKFEDLKKIKTYNTSFMMFSNNPDMRFSSKFQRPAGQFVMSELNNISNKKIKDIISEPILLGVGVSPKDFNSNGNFYYISMATIKNWKVELDESQLLSDEYVKINGNKKVKKNDIIMTRSGVAIGKFAFVEEDFNGIFADFTMRIRIKDYNPLFAYYYFRTSYFQYLIEIYKRGVQNQNIYPSLIQEFPIPNVNSTEQLKIIKTLKNEIDEQNNIKNQIYNKRLEIEEILLNTINDVKKINI